MNRWTEEDWRRAQQKAAHAPKKNATTVDASGQPVKKPPKYRNRPTTVMGPDGQYVEFPSKREAERYQSLRLLEIADRIRNLKLQVKYHFDVNDVHVCDYIADFKYEEWDGQARIWRLVVEDAKGMKTPEYIIKRKLMRAMHGIKVRET